MTRVTERVRCPTEGPAADPRVCEDVRMEQLTRTVSRRELESSVYTTSRTVVQRGAVLKSTLLHMRS